jgi:hypothetical protein
MFFFFSYFDGDILKFLPKSQSWYFHFFSSSPLGCQFSSEKNTKANEEHSFKVEGMYSVVLIPRDMF